MIVTYVDGTWTDHLAVGRYGLRNGAELLLTIDVAGRVNQDGKVGQGRAALREFASKRGKIDTIQLTKPQFMTQLRERMSKLECPRICVRLARNGNSVTYPAAVVFGPDAVTLNLG